jgi:hypothetical protein
MADLLVELYGTRVGMLSGPWRTFDFLATSDAVVAFGIDSQILSMAIPLTVVPVRSRKDRRQNFFLGSRLTSSRDVLRARIHELSAGILSLCCGLG